MKITLLITLLMICGIAQSQNLKLKPGQRFSYEGVNSSEWKNGDQSSSSYGYWRTKFEVISHKNGVYTLKASPEQFLTEWGENNILDSKADLSEQPNVFLAVANKIMANSSYELVMDENGNIKAINGLAEIQAAVLSKVKELRIPETYQKHPELLDALVGEDRVKMLSSFFKRSAKELDTAYVSKNTDQITQYKLKKLAIYGNPTGLIPSSSLDSAETTKSATGAVTANSRTVRKFNLIVPGSKSMPDRSPLLAEATSRMGYDDYYTPFKKATRKIQDLAMLFREEKGSQTIEANILHQLDSLDKGFAKDDYQYMGARLGILTYLNTGGYWETLNKVPYEFLPHSNDVENKLTRDLSRGDFSNVKKAITLSFTKFKGDDYYLRNMENTSNTIHDNFGGLIYRLQDKDSLKQALGIIQEIEALKIPIATELLAGMKTYVRAKLATSPGELAAIANTQFNSVFDKAGRYRLLIYDELVKKRVPDSIKLAYIDYTIDLDKKKIDLLNSGSIENVSPFIFKHFILPNKVIYKKNLADAYYRKSQLLKTTETAYLQMAADHLPSQQDRVDNDHALKVDYRFIPYVSYTDLYLASGGNAGMSDEARLQKNVEMVILEPERYTKLKEDYMKVFPTGDFKTFFNNTLKAKLPAVPKFSLQERSGLMVANKDQASKFVFVDFWGTWCGACVAEIDKIDAIHLKNPSPDKLVVTTIACFDKKKNVDDFMSRTKYSYQVLMSDGKVEIDFKIRSYPTKLLLLPNGVYLTIPFQSDYQDILNKYLEWEI
ncbi:MAG TPA: TlpA disulfide reductase family protein [Pedobacter sp.]|nr:TlpA disulfide reductase family protein [Pedobacter sp.]